MAHKIEVWLQELRDQGKSENTLRVYEAGINHLLNHFPGVEPEKFLARDIIDWRSHQQTREKASPSTINTRLAAVRSFFSWLLGDQSPAAEIGNVDIPKKKPQALTQSEQRSFLRAVHSSDNLRDIAIVETLLGTGVRAEELLALQVGDLTIRERSGEIVVREGKGSKFRIIPLPLVTRHALRAFLSEEHPDSENENAFLWTGQRGPLSSTSTIFRLLSKYAYDAHLDPFGPHVLRHTYATRYLEQNPSDIRGLADLLGHEDINTTMKYTQVTLEDLQKRVENL